MRAASLVILVLLSAAVMCLSACASRAKCAPTQGAPAQAAGAPAQDAPGCEEAIRTAAQNVPEVAARDPLAEAVATCIKEEWSAESRRCVAAARDQPDLVACMMRHERQKEAEAQRAETRERAPGDERGTQSEAGVMSGTMAGSRYLSVNSIEPDRGDIEGDTYVIIKGSRFVADGPRAVQVYFGTRQGTVVRFASDRELIVRAPGGKPGEVVDVLVVFEPGGQLKLPAAFTFVDKSRYVPLP